MLRSPHRRASGLLASLALAACGGPAAPAPPPRSALLVTIDTLRADRVGCYGHAGAETPVLDALAERGVLFERASATVPITLPSHASVLTGTAPPFHGARDNGTHRVPDEIETLPEVLAARGWRTAAAVAAFVLDAQFGLAQGFEAYGNVPLSRFRSGSEVLERPAGEVNAEALAWLDGVGPDEPFFLWAHYFEPHRPWPAPSARPAALRDRPYDADIAAADRALGELLDGLERRGRLAETLVVVTSDHGESLGEHGEETHSFFVYEATLHVPLVLAHASLPRGVRVPDAVSLVDVMPTVLELLGVEPPALPPPARSLASLCDADPTTTLAAAPAYFESLNPLNAYGWAPLQGVALAGWKLVEAPRPELYDLERDSAELENRAAAEPERLARLREILAELLAANERPAHFAAPERALSADERGRLAALGYTGVAAPSGRDRDRRDPKDGIALVQRKERAFLLYSEGRLDEVRPLLEELLRDDPDNPVFRSHLGALLLNQGRFREALPHLERSLELGFRTADNLTALAQAHLMTNRPERAEELLREALAVDGKQLLALDLLSQVLAARGERAAARRSVERFLELWRGDARVAREMRQRLAALGG